MNNALLETLVVTQIATLALTIKQGKAAGGMTTTSDGIHDAVRLIERQRPEILRLLAETQTRSS